MPTILQEIEQKRFLTEWHLPVSSRLSIRELTLLASSCKSVGCHMVVFAYSAAVGRPLPETPKQDDLQKIAKNTGLVKILTRLDIEDIGEIMVSTTARDKNNNNNNNKNSNSTFINLSKEEIAEKNEAIVKGIQSFLSQASAKFDIISILLKQDPFLFDTLNVNEIFSPFLTKCPLIINIDDCPVSQLVLPRQRVPQGSVIEFSQCRLIDSKNNFDCNVLSNLRKQLSHLKRYKSLVSCGGQNIFPNDVEDAIISKIRSQLDSACLMESLCGRNDLLATNKQMSLNVVLRMKAVEAKKRQKEMKDKLCVGKKRKLKTKQKLLLQEKLKQKDGKKKAKKPLTTTSSSSGKVQKDKAEKKNVTASTKKTAKKSSRSLAVKVSKPKDDGDDGDDRKKVVPLTSNLLAQILRSQLVSKKAINKRAAIRAKHNRKKAKVMAGLKKREKDQKSVTKIKDNDSKKQKKKQEAEKKTEDNNNKKAETVPEESFSWGEDI